jgi:hypothetical protein
VAAEQKDSFLAVNAGYRSSESLQLSQDIVHKPRGTQQNGKISIEVVRLASCAFGYQLRAM